jgi:putative endonuclease
MEAPPPGSTRAKGQRVEAVVALHLERHGLAIEARNVSIGGAELDLVARDLDASEETIVFVEVRSRHDDERGSPLETVDRLKQRKLIRGATAWLVAQNLWEKVAVRFDVVGVVDPSGSHPRLEWIRNAFQVDG